MQILPAIDLKNGQCVRLRQGRKDEATVYASDPVEMALRWESLGAEWIHLVDLDGAFAGKPVHAEVIARICAGTLMNITVCWWRWTQPSQPTSRATPALLA